MCWISTGGNNGFTRATYTLRGSAAASTAVKAIYSVNSNNKKKQLCWRRLDFLFSNTVARTINRNAASGRLSYFLMLQEELGMLAQAGFSCFLYFSRKQERWLRLDFLSRKGAFHTNFSVTAQ